MSERLPFIIRIRSRFMSTIVDTTLARIVRLPLVPWPILELGRMPEPLVFAVGARQPSGKARRNARNVDLPDQLTNSANILH
jgi:hypothetical protein